MFREVALKPVFHASLKMWKRTCMCHWKMRLRKDFNPFLAVVSRKAMPLNAQLKIVSEVQDSGI